MSQLSFFVYFICIGVVLGLLNIRRIFSKSVIAVIILLDITLLVEISAMWLIKIIKIKNHFLYNLFTPIQLALILSVFYFATKSSNVKRRIPPVSICFLFFFIFNIIAWQGWNKFNSYTFIFSGLIITFFTLLYLLELYNSEGVTNFLNNPIFWFCIGILFYFPANIIVTGFIYEIYSYSKDLSRDLYQINKKLNILMYGFFLYSIIVELRNNRKSNLLLT